MSKTVAVMQPYFFPYAGYFRLFSHADEFVILDCVQFPRRGRVHRSEVSRTPEGPQWLTLPLQPQPREVRICELAFAAHARQEFDARLDSFAWMKPARGGAGDAVRRNLRAPMHGVVDFIEGSLRMVLDLLGIDTPITRSSSLGLPPGLRGQERIIRIALERGATTYLNAPGGVDLYDPAPFAANGMKLDFLPAYQGKFMHLLPALMATDPRTIAVDIGARPGEPVANGKPQTTAHSNE